MVLKRSEEVEIVSFEEVEINFEEVETALKRKK